MLKKRIVKRQRLHLLASGTLQTVNELLSESLKDSHINDDEFKKILNVYQRHLCDIKDQNDAFVKSNLLEKDELMNTLNNAFKK